MEPITMLKRIYAVALAAAALAGSLLLASPAGANPHRPVTRNATPGCVTIHEESTIELNPAKSRRDVERLWGVTHRINVTSTTDGIGSYNAYVYKSCGHSLDRVQVILMTERRNRPGYTPEPPGRRIVISIIWWKIPPDVPVDLP